MLWQHDPAEPVGCWLSLAEDARGLRVEGRLNLAVQRGRELDALLREGGLDGLSIGFRTVRSTPERGGLRRLHSVDLWEISLVTFPLLPGARIARKAEPAPPALPLAAEIRALARRVAPPRRPAAPPSTRPGAPQPPAARPPRPSRFA